MGLYFGGSPPPPPALLVDACGSFRPWSLKAYLFNSQSIYISLKVNQMYTTAQAVEENRQVNIKPKEMLHKITNERND